MGTQVLNEKLTLAAIALRLHELDDSSTIYAEKLDGVWKSSSAAILLSRSERENRPVGFVYFLEVFVANDVLRAWSFARNNRIPSADESVIALIHYAEHDAYIMD